MGLEMMAMVCLAYAFDKIRDTGYYSYKMGNVVEILRRRSIWQWLLPGIQIWLIVKEIERIPRVNSKLKGLRNVLDGSRWEKSHLLCSNKCRLWTEDLIGEQKSVCFSSFALFFNRLQCGRSPVNSVECLTSKRWHLFKDVGGFTEYAGSYGSGFLKLTNSLPLEIPSQVDNF